MREKAQIIAILGAISEAALQGMEKYDKVLDTLLPSLIKLIFASREGATTVERVLAALKEPSVPPS